MTTPTAETATPAAASTLPANVIDQVVALYDFQATTKETIGFPKDAVINILEKSGEWWLGEYQGNIGLLPYNYVQSLGTKPANRECPFCVLLSLKKDLASLGRPWLWLVAI